MKRCHFIGIGGAGMAPLARLLQERGVRITGSDLEENAKIAELRSAGALIRIGHTAENLPGDAELVVFSSAVTPGNPEFSVAQKLGIPCLRRGEMLARFVRQYRRVVAVSGSHGKSSTTAILAHILERTGRHPGFMIGAAVNGGGPSAANGAGDDLFVTEVDESDGTHTFIHSHLGIVPNVDTDHAWSVGGVEQLHRNFGTFAAQAEHLLYYADPVCDRVFADHPCAERMPLPSKEFTVAGFHGFQARNVRLAVRAAALLGVPEPDALAAAESFPGIGRRMHVCFASEKLVVMEDYAHHPKEVEAAVSFLREQYPGYHLRIVFQPHRYARLEQYFEEFVRVLKAADSVYVAPVFAAWTETGKVDSRDLASRLTAHTVSLPWSAAAKSVLSDLPAVPMVIAVLGAGDVNHILDDLPGGRNF